MNKDLIKQVIKEMVDSGELIVYIDTAVSHSGYDSFGNGGGGIDEIEVSAYLEVKEVLC